MRTRLAVISVIFGLVLLATALVRYVTARDVQRQDTTAPLQDIPAVVGLLAAGAALVAGGAAALARWSRPALAVLTGMIILGAAGALYLRAGDVQRHEQAVLDRRWTEEVGRVARRFPPALPGGRPDPAPLRGLPVVLGLLSGGVVLVSVGVGAFVLRSSRLRRPPLDHHG